MAGCNGLVSRKTDRYGKTPPQCHLSNESPLRRYLTQQPTPGANRDEMHSRNASILGSGRFNTTCSGVLKCWYETFVLVVCRYTVGISESQVLLLQLLPVH